MSTKDLKRVLGKADLMGIAIGQIIGAGVMSLTGVAIAMTGRSSNFAFLVSTLFVLAAAIPLVFVNSCIRMRGGAYTQTSIFLGKKWSGFYIVQYIVGSISISMFVISLAQYILTFIPNANEKIVSMAVLTLFFGIFKIQPGYFNQPDFMTNGVMGILQTAALLVFATGGASVYLFCCMWGNICNSNYIECKDRNLYKTCSPSLF